MDGVINVDKPAGMSSAAVVTRVKRGLPHGVKVGHAGTLDPFATRVLVVLVGKGTRQAERFMSEPKQYLATIKLGATTETLDLESEEIVTEGALAPAREAVEEALRRFVSNNGLHDVWVLWNDSNKPAGTSLIFRDGFKPASAMEVTTHQPIPVQSPAGEARLADLQFEPMETRAFLTPRNEITAAPRRWFELQRSWWRGTAVPGKPLAAPQPKHALDLTDDWTFKPLVAAPADEVAMAAGNLDDSQWERMRFGIVSLPDHPGVRHGVFRKRFVVPAGWNRGRVMLWVQSWAGTTFADSGRVYLDGKALRDRAMADGIAGDDLTEILKPGSSHVLAVILSGNGSLVGPRGSTWLAYVPDPQARQDLSGDWAGSPDGLTYTAPAPLTERWAGMVARRMVRADAAQARKNVVIHASARPGVLQGVIVNGHYVMRFHHRIGRDIDLNVTLWFFFGQDNEIVLVASGGTSPCGIRNVELRFYDRDIYP